MHLLSCKGTKRHIFPVEPYSCFHLAAKNVRLWKLAIAEKDNVYSGHVDPPFR